MIENKYFENIKKELKVKYPKLDFNFDLEYNNDLAKLQRAPKNCISTPTLIADTQHAIA